MKASLVLSAAALLLSGTAASAAVPEQFEAQAEAIMSAAYPADGPGAAVIVVDDGRIVYAAGQGLADIEAKRPITPATVFRMGSITKQFSAAVMLQLVAEGKVSLDDRLSEYLPGYPGPGADATIEQLLNHTAGVQSYTDIPGFMSNDEMLGRPYTTEQMIDVFKDLPSPSRPGEEWAYNNSGYVLVGAVIEAVTGKPWHEAVEERIARPLGLTSIRYGTAEAGMRQMARGYTEQDGRQVPARRIHMSVPHAAGALIGSVEDMAKWAQALHGGRVVRPDLYARMIAPTRLPDGETEPYGFGLQLGELRGRQMISHGGGIPGFSTASGYLPGDDLFVAVFANSDDPVSSPGVTLQRIAAVAVGDPYPQFQQVPADMAAIEPFLGVYKIGEDERLFFERDGKLYTRRTGGSNLEALPAGNGRFFYGPGNLSWFEVKRDEAGQAIMAMYQNGNSQPELSTRVGPVPAEPQSVELPRATLERYAGRYRTERGFFATVKLGEDNQLRVELGSQRPVTIKPVSETGFLAEGVDATLTFQLDAGAVIGFVINQGGRELPATRVD